MPDDQLTDDRLDAARRYLEDHHHAVLVTRRSGGELQTSPVAVALDADGHAVVSTREGSAKERNLTRDPRVSLCAVPDEWWGPWVHLDGTVEIVRLPDALDLLVDYYRRIAGEHDDWDAYRRAMTEERRVALVVTLDHAGPVVGG